MRQIYMRFVYSGLLVALIALAHSSVAGDWPSWRGPNHNGISTENGWSTQWPKEGPRQLWKVNVGLGYATVSVANGRVFTSGNQKDTDTVFCFDTETGKEVWKHSYSCPLVVGPKYYDGGTSSTPTVDGGNVFYLSRTGLLFCFEATAGKILWEKNLKDELGLTLNQWGFAGSPIVDGELLLLNVGSAGTALDKKTGSVVWQSGKEAAGYSSIVPFTSDQGVRCLAFMTLKALVIVEEKTGKELARVPWETGFDTNCADPIVSGDTLFISSFDRGGATMRFTAGKIVFGWKDWTMHNHLNTSVLLNDHLFGINGQAGKAGDLRCVDFKTGEAKWVQPGIGIGALMAADGKLIVLSEKGELIIAEASTESFKPIVRAQVLGAKCWTMPVLANGRIYCRNGRGDLVCLDVR